MNNEEKILNLLTQMQVQMNDMQSQMDNLETKVDSNHQEILLRFDKLENQFQELEGSNAANHVSTNTKLNKISDDLDFLTHKEFQTEKEMFHLKRKLTKQRKYIK